MAIMLGPTSNLEKSFRHDCFKPGRSWPKPFWLAHDRADEFRGFAPDHAFWATVLQTVVPIAPSNSRSAFSSRLRAT
jgi:hypothetical protein